MNRPTSNQSHGGVSDEPSSDETLASTETATKTRTNGELTKEEAKKKPSKIKELWDKLGLDWPTLRTMLKAAVAPTICLSFYQADAVANEFTTLGYLVAIASILSMSIMPRAKYLQTLVYNVIAVCIGAAVSILSIYTIIQARHNTTPPGGSLTAYNSSASAVAGIWLFFQIYLINAIKSARPQFMFPAILTSIFAVVAMSYGANFPDMAAGLSFAKRLITAFLTGFGIATGVNLFIFPVSSRLVVFGEMTGYIGSFKGFLKLQQAYLHSLEEIDMFREPIPQAAAVQGAVGGIKALHGKLALDLQFSKREFAYGKLSASDISQMFKLLRSIMLPITGLTAMIDILQNIADNQGYANQDEGNALLEADEQRAVREWQLIMRTLHEPFIGMATAMDEALEHILLTLEFKKPEKGDKAANTKDEDVEAKGDTVCPGTPGFTHNYERQTNEFYQSREVSLRDWCEQKGIQLPSTDSFEVTEHSAWPSELEKTSTVSRGRDQRQMFVVLYMEWLMWSVSRAILDFAKFADSKVEDGTMKQKRFIYPGQKRMRKWLMSAFHAEATSDEHQFDMNGSNGANQHNVFLGQAFGGRKDPEHLPPTNKQERFGNAIRGIPRALRSSHSNFGFRVACAVMTISIVAFLRDTATFFLHQRLFWASIMVAISMNRLAGQSIFNFLLRVTGTFVAMVASYVVYYIVDGHTAGVLVFEFIWIACAYWIVVKKPKYVVVGIISAVTSVLIIGYELQVKKIGVVLSESNYQGYYPVYILAPYRLACVSGGLLVAFIWTFFPYPVSEHSEIRKDLGAGLFSLANYYAIVHETVGARVRGEEGDLEDKTSPGRRLEKARLQVYAQQVQLVQNLKVNSGFGNWQINIGGKFPKELYGKLIVQTENLLNWTALISYASNAFSPDKVGDNAWQDDFRQLLGSIQTTSHDITSRLCILSSSISNGTPLPPYMKPLEPYGLLSSLQAVDKDILGVSHIAEPGYAAFAVMQIASRSLIHDLNKLTEYVH